MAGGGGGGGGRLLNNLCVDTVSRDMNFKGFLLSNQSYVARCNPLYNLAKLALDSILASPVQCKGIMQWNARSALSVTTCPSMKLPLYPLQSFLNQFA